VIYHHVEQLKRCKNIFIVVTAETYWRIKHHCKHIHPGLIYVVEHIESSQWTAVNHLHSVFSYLWNKNTVSIWWYANIMLQHEILWRPSTDMHDIVCFESVEHQNIAVAWTYSGWLQIKAHNALPIGSHVVINSQKIWTLDNQLEYFRYVVNTMNALEVTNNDFGNWKK
jgi:hypothetical protein